MGKLGLKHGFVFSLLLFLGSCYKYSYNYKLIGDTRPETHAQPAQTALSEAAEKPVCCKGPYCWEFTPVFNYDITGLVFGVSHKLASDFDAVFAADTGLLWGENSAKELYKRVKLRVMMDHYDAWWKDGVKFNLREAANTHLATCDAAAFSAIKKIKPGDQVRLRGWLVNAKASKEPGETDPRKILKWRTSVNRDDLGEGACEVMYVRSPEDIQILEKGPRRWLWLQWLGGAGMVLTVIVWQRRLRRELAEVQKADF